MIDASSVKTSDAIDTASPVDGRTIAERIRAISHEIKSPTAIADRIGCSPGYVSIVLWRMEHPDYQAKWIRERRAERREAGE